MDLHWKLGIWLDISLGLIYSSNTNFRFRVVRSEYYPNSFHPILTSTYIQIWFEYLHRHINGYAPSLPSGHLSGAKVCQTYSRKLRMESIFSCIYKQKLDQMLEKRKIFSLSLRGTNISFCIRRSVHDPKNISKHFFFTLSVRYMFDRHHECSQTSAIFFIYLCYCLEHNK